MRNLTRTFVCLILLGVFISGIFFVSEDPYSINKKQTTFGETRSVAQLIFSTNRLELKEKIEITFKKPSFLFGLKFLNEINLSTFVNNLFIFEF